MGVAGQDHVLLTLSSRARLSRCAALRRHYPCLTWDFAGTAGRTAKDGYMRSSLQIRRYARLSHSHDTCYSVTPTYTAWRLRAPHLRYLTGYTIRPHSGHRAT